MIFASFHALFGRREAAAGGVVSVASQPSLPTFHDTTASVFSRRDRPMTAADMKRIAEVG